jgi:tetratricopeptide (TPR) repeat protein
MSEKRQQSAVAKVVGAMVILCLGGCMGVSPIPTSDGTGYQARSVTKKNGFTVSEDASVDADAKEDFHAAISALKAGETEKGIELLEKVVKTSPKASAPYINLAMAYAGTNRFDRAEENLKKAIELNPDHPVANNEYGLLYRKTGRFAEARAMYEKVLAQYPGFQPARKNLGVLCDMYLQDLECALKNYRVYNAAVPDDKPVTIWIADLERRLGQ